MYQAMMIKNSKRFILYCSLAGLISAWAISGMLVTVDYASGTPVGSFFAVIGFSLGYYDVGTAEAVGFTLHLLTGMTAGNIFGQFAVFWPAISPFNVSRGVISGMMAGMALWAVLFVPLATFGIQARIDDVNTSPPNQSVRAIVSHFDGLYYYLIVGGAFAFHLAYGAFMGLIAGRMYELREKMVKKNELAQK